MNGLDDEARAIALGFIDTFQEAKAKAKMAVGHTAGLVWEDLNTINNYLGDPRNGWIGMNPLGRSLQEGVGLTSALLGKIVFHGSPHKFEKFAMSKIGTGEGAQAYGHGLYFAENPQVAKQYAKDLSGIESLTDKSGSVLLQKQGGKYISPYLNSDDPGAKRLGQAFSQLIETRGDVDEALKLSTSPEIKASLEWIKKQGGIKYNAGPDASSVYHVDLPDESIAKMLDWDKPLSQQPDVMNVLPQLGFKKYGQKPFENHWVGPNGTLIDPAQSGGESIMTELGTGERATRILKQAGIPGLKYRDAGSRAAKEGTSNFVVFDDTLPKIVGRE
jgi:hypothetical protein